MLNKQLNTVSVIIPCRNEEKYIGKCLDSIITQNYPLELMEILVVDGMSNDRTRTIVESYQKRYNYIRLLDNEQKIVPSGLNKGIQNAKGEIIIIMGAHTEYAFDYVSQCINVLSKSGADNVGGPALTKTSSYIQDAIAIAYKSHFGVGGAKSHFENYEGYVDTVTYGCYPKSVFTRIGLFDEELVRNQDDEFNLRLIRAGGKIWQSPRIKSWYYPRISLLLLYKQYKQYGYWKVRVIQKHKIPASIRHIIPGTFLGSLIICMLFGTFFRVCRLTLLLLLSLYFLVNLLITLWICKNPLKWKYIPILPLIFMTYHFSYGYGFLRGIMDFVIIRRKNSFRKFSQLTR